jgi:hypothetical protein
MPEHYLQTKLNLGIDARPSQTSHPSNEGELNSDNRVVARQYLQKKKKNCSETMGKLNKNGIMTGMVVYTCNPHIETGRS